jgi:hypothetical protein
LPDGSEQPPADVHALAERRAHARRDRDFAAADALRDEIADAGWLIRDAADGYVLRPRPAYEVLDNVTAIPHRDIDDSTGQRATVALLVEGWRDDLDTCLRALLDHRPADVRVLALDIGNVDEVGQRLHDYAHAQPDVIDELHVEAPTRYGEARAALLRQDTAPVHIWMDTSTVLDGDVITPLLAAMEDQSVVGAGWRGVNVDDDWHQFHDAGPGEVEALLGYLFAMRSAAARRVAADPDSPFAKARFYRNADLELSFWLRDGGGRLVVPTKDLPVHQTRHRGYHDSEVAHRDRESKRNYDRFRTRFRGREDLRLPH